jgi:hypothetical protein
MVVKNEMPTARPPMTLEKPTSRVTKTEMTGSGMATAIYERRRAAVFQSRQQVSFCIMKILSWCRKSWIQNAKRIHFPQAREVMR